MDEKKCNKCGELKHLTDYHKKHDTKDGYRHTCKECVNEFMKGYRKEHKEERSAYDKKRYKEKGEDIREHKKKFYQEHREELVEKKRIYREKNRKDINKRRKIKYENDPEYRESVKNWKKVNKNWWDIYMKKYKDERPHEIAWRSLLHSTLKRLGSPKEGHTIDMLGYSALDLKEHLESTFVSDMSWDNHGDIWHIDHIIPVSSFSPDTPVSEVCALDNLQVLYITSRIVDGVEHIGNLNKGDKLF